MPEIPVGMLQTGRVPSSIPLIENRRHHSQQMFTSRAQPVPILTPLPWALRTKRSRTQKEKSPANPLTESQKGDFDIKIFQNQNTVKIKKNSMDSR
jgi:hypothetical protein